LYVYAGDYMPYSLGWMNAWVDQVSSDVKEVQDVEDFLTNYSQADLLDLRTCNQ
jgi:hypothetical protein